jgi:hypothetical protein
MQYILISIDILPTFIRVLICIPLIDLFTCIFRVFRSLSQGNLFGMLYAILAFACRILFIWIPGLLYMIVTGKLFRD